MKILKILDWPEKRYYGETHPFYRWASQLRANDIKVQFYYDHQDKALKDADCLLIHSRYFSGWQNLNTRSEQNEHELLAFLLEMKQCSGKLIWFDAADSTGSGDFSIIPFVDVFLKKQILKNSEYYSAENGIKDLRIWLNSNDPKNSKTAFVRCPEEQVNKIKLGWNLGLNDYRYFGYKMSRLSNFLNYNIYPLRFSSSDKQRKYDLTFRGTIHQDNHTMNRISYQRNHIIGLFDHLNFNIAKGCNVSKARYWKELRNSKLSVSPFGWGEICYRDFETFISGSLLVKPLMSHMLTFPDVYIPDKTYIPVAWNMIGTKELLEQLIVNYKEVRYIAQNGQDTYRHAMNDAQGFIDVLKQNVTG
ncbi:glycosyltransferase family 1 protein [Pedobacter frigoris]|uniref:glycosyltransferase family 1 protein n=1 Tax=Pedobacter frigoris TaxID=2571272 RepID=UPI00292FB0AE|nr:glycosyltransferase family 1 protein [Pedobacter frigoris]